MLRFNINNSAVMPFQYFEGEGAFPSTLMEKLITWLENGAPWKMARTDFYEQFEFDLTSSELPNTLQVLKDRVTLADLRKRVEGQFNVSLRDNIDITAHKLIPGQRIQIHNDFIDGGETYRLILQLNKNWEPSDGGFLMLFASDDPTNVHRVVPPVYNSLLGFAISENSYHAVSTVNSGQRFTLVFSFYDR